MTAHAMTAAKAILALAIEDRIDLRFSGSKERYLSVGIPESDDYFQTVHRLIQVLLGKLLRSFRGTEAGNLFNTVAATVISVPGVVRDNRTLLQLPLWHSPAHHTVQWTHDGRAKEFFDFAEELAGIVESLIGATGATWRATERDRFMDTVFVVNDATACAAGEWEKRGHGKDGADFVYMKIHSGVNVGVVERTFDGKVSVKTVHAEAGHSFPVVHLYDHEAQFEGICGYHGSCFEGMMAVHGLYQRTVAGRSSVFENWKPALDRLEARGLRGQELDNALLDHILGDDARKPAGKGEGVELVAHYAGQLAYQLSIGPLAPRRIVVGGQMARPAVIDAIRRNVVQWARGYPKRPELTKEGIVRHIVRGFATAGDEAGIEIQGALAIAFARANWRPAAQGNVVPLFARAEGRR